MTASVEGRIEVAAQERALLALRASVPAREPDAPVIEAADGGEWSDARALGQRLHDHRQGPSHPLVQHRLAERLAALTNKYEDRTI